MPSMWVTLLWMKYVRSPMHGAVRTNVTVWRSCFRVTKEADRITLQAVLKMRCTPTPYKQGVSSGLFTPRAATKLKNGKIYLYEQKQYVDIPLKRRLMYIVVSAISQRKLHTCDVLTRKARLPFTTHNTATTDKMFQAKRVRNANIPYADFKS